MGTRIVLLFFCGVASLAAQPDIKSSFEGMVVDATTGEPVRKAYLMMVGDQANDRAVSAVDGHFVLAGLGPGEYRLHVERQGYLDCDCLSGVKIGTGQKVTGVQIKLTKYGAVSGRVVDADGDPWPQGSVEVYRLGWRHGKRQLQDQDQADVDDRGEFRIGKLPPGRYYVAAQPAGRSATRSVNYQTSFYPGVLEPSAAAAIQLGGGQEVSGIEIRLQSAPTYRVRGRINGLDLAEFSGPKAGNRLMMGMYRTSGLFEDWLDAQLDRKPDGTFEFRGVPSGSYAIRIASMSGGFGQAMTDAGLGENLVQVSGHDVNDVVIDVIPAREFKPAVQVEGVDHPDLSSVALNLFADDGSTASTSADEDFVFPKVAPRNYQVHLRGASSSKYFVKSVRVGGVEFAGSTLDLRHTGDAPVTIILSAKGAAIKGRLRTDTPDPTSTTVTLIPDVPDADRREREASEASTDQNGVFTINNIPPGEYRLFAWRDLPDEAWQDADLWTAIREKGVSVKLAESESKLIELPPISQTEIAALLTRLGIQ